MKKALVLLLAVFATVANAAHNWENPDSPFDGSVKMSDTVQVKWVTANNVQSACEAESRRRGNGGFGSPMQACSFWTKTTEGMECTIITPKNPTIHNLGHELRHCFQGNYH